MIDYLEEFAEQSEDALFEAEQKLTTALASAERSGKNRDGSIEQAETLTGGSVVQMGRNAETLTSGFVAQMGRNAETLGGVPIEATNKNQETAKKSVEQSLFEVEKTLPLMDAVRVLEAVQVRNFMQRVQIGSTARSSETQLEGAGRRILGETTALESRTIENNWADLTGITGTGNRSMGTSDRSGEILRAERLDQVFRRDSRRYDGGFFLY